MDSVCTFVVDDDVLVATTIELALEDNGFRPHTAHSAEKGLALSRTMVTYAEPW